MENLREKNVCSSNSHRVTVTSAYYIFRKCAINKTFVDCARNVDLTNNTVTQIIPSLPLEKWDTNRWDLGNIVSNLLAALERFRSLVLVKERTKLAAGQFY